MKADYFLQRVGLGIADLARGSGKLKTVNLRESELELVQRASMALEGEDISDDTLKLLKDAFATGPLGPKLLQAFWSQHQTTLSQTQSTRLLVNPPVKLDPGASSTMTVSTQPWLNGRYGMCLGKLPSAVEQMGVISENHGFFDDVVVFWDYGVDFEQLCRYLIPGSVLTLVRPNKELHGKWAAVAGLDLSFTRMLETIESHFGLKMVVSSSESHVHSVTLGVESL
jgi:hypothetical protein